jgi:segregation and condensation protein B
MPSENVEEEYKRLIEAALFVSGKAMSQEELAGVLGIASVGAAGKLADKLAEEYKTRKTAISVVKMGGKYSMMVKEQYASKVGALSGPPDISRGALRILAFVSKNEPVMQSSIVKAFGDSSYVYIKELIEKEFVTGRRSGRTKRLDTTPKFLEYFNLAKQQQ